jgi:hypothetical protein
MSNGSLSVASVLDFIKQSTRSERIARHEDVLTNQSTTPQDTIDVITELIEETTPQRGGLFVDKNLLREVAAINLLIDYDIDLAAKMVFQFMFKHNMIDFEGERRGVLVFKKQMVTASLNFLQMFFRLEELDTLAPSAEDFKLRCDNWADKLDSWRNTYQSAIRNELRVDTAGIQSVRDSEVAEFNLALSKFKINLNVDNTEVDSLRSKSIWVMYKDYLRSLQSEDTKLSFSYYYTQILIYCNLDESSWLDRNPFSSDKYTKGLEIFRVIGKWADGKMREDGTVEDILRLMRLDLYTTFGRIFRPNDQVLETMVEIKILTDSLDKQFQLFSDYSSNTGGIVQFNRLNREYLSRTFMGTNSRLDNEIDHIEFQIIEFKQDAEDRQPKQALIGEAIRFKAVVFHNTATYTVGTAVRTASAGERHSIFVSLEELGLDDLSRKITNMLRGSINNISHDSKSMWLRVRGLKSGSGSFKLKFTQCTCLNEVIQEDSGFQEGIVSFNETSPTYGNYRLQVYHYISLGGNNSGPGRSPSSGVSLSQPTLQGRQLWPYRNLRTNVVTSGITRMQYVNTLGKYRRNFSVDNRGTTSQQRLAMKKFRMTIPYNIFTVLLSSLDTFSKLIIKSFESSSKEGVTMATISSKRGLHSCVEPNWRDFKLRKAVDSALLVVKEIFVRGNFERDGRSGSFLDLLTPYDCRLNSMNKLGDASTRLLEIPRYLTADNISTIINFIYTTINSLFILAWWRSIYYNYEHLIAPLGRSDIAPRNSVEVVDYVLWSTYTATGLYTAAFDAPEDGSLANLKKIGRYITNRAAFQNLLRRAAIQGNRQVLVYEHTFNVIMNELE